MCLIKEGGSSLKRSMSLSSLTSFLSYLVLGAVGREVEVEEPNTTTKQQNKTPISGNRNSHAGFPAVSPGEEMDLSLYLRVIVSQLSHTKEDFFFKFLFV